MEQISHVSNQMGAERLAHLQLAQQADRENRAAAPAAGETRGDEADISELGRVLGQAHDQPGVRADKVAAARLAIEQNEEQFIRERLDATADRLAEELGIQNPES